MTSPHPPTTAQVYAAVAQSVRNSAYIIRLAAQNATDPENKAIYEHTAAALEAGAGTVESLASRVRELEAFVQHFLDNFEDCSYCENGIDETGDQCSSCHGTGKRLASYGVLYVELPDEARRLLDGAK